MDFRYGSSFAVDSPDAYETLLLDAMVGDASLFTRDDEVERAWQILDPILDACGIRGGRSAALLRGRDLGPTGGRRAARARRSGVAPAMTVLEPAATEEQAVHERLMRFGEHASLATPMWEERDTSVRAIAAHLASLWDAAGSKRRRRRSARDREGAARTRGPRSSTSS